MCTGCMFGVILIEVIARTGDFHVNFRIFFLGEAEDMYKRALNVQSYISILKQIGNQHIQSALSVFIYSVF